MRAPTMRTRRKPRSRSGSPTNVDEVEGVLRFAASALLPAPTTLAHAATMHTRGLLAWRDTTLGLLDADRVFDSLARSLR